MFIVEHIAQVLEKSSTIHLDGNEERKSKAEIKQLLDDLSFNILMKNGVVVFNGMLIRKA